MSKIDDIEAALAHIVARLTDQDITAIDAVITKVRMRRAA